MSFKKQTLKYGAAAIAMGFAIIAASLMVSNPATNQLSQSFTSSSTGASSSSATTSAVSASTSTSSPGASTISSATTTSTEASTVSSSAASSTTTSQGSQQGVLSILLTDPPNIPDGVTKVYVTYSNLGVHVSGAGNQSGWTQVQQSGTIELLGTVNVTLTLSTVKLQSGNYNLIRFNITNALVTYNGKNYTAFVPLSELTTPIIGGIEVQTGNPSAAVIDISPTVFNMGSQSNPEFIIRSVATAFAVPSSEVNEQMEHQGFRMSLQGKAWWKLLQEKYTANLQITGASLTANSLSVNVKNTGDQNDSLKLIVVSPVASTLAGRRMRVPTMFFDSTIFIIENNGTLVPLQKLLIAHPFLLKDNANLIKQLYQQVGYNVSSGATATFSYKGQMTLGLAMMKTTHTITAGQQYLITVLGDEALASTVVVAG